jgi:hypothetical protein
MGTSPPIVTASAVRKTYDTGAVRVEALRGVDLTLERGLTLHIVTRSEERRGGKVR